MTDGGSVSKREEERSQEGQIHQPATLPTLLRREGRAEPRGKEMKKEGKDKRGVEESGGGGARKQRRTVKANMPDSKHMIISLLVY